MRKNVRTALPGIAILLVLWPTSAQAPSPQPLVLPLACASGGCLLLQGVPETAGLRSGFVKLKPGETVGWDSTTEHEEALVILHGRGEARIEGQPVRPFAAPRLLYIPPLTRHNIANTGDVLLEYVYVVAPVAGSGPGRPNKN